MISVNVRFHLSYIVFKHFLGKLVCKIDALGGCQVFEFVLFYSIVFNDFNALEGSYRSIVLILQYFYFCFVTTVLKAFGWSSRVVKHCKCGDCQVFEVASFNQCVLLISVPRRPQKVTLILLIL